MFVKEITKRYDGKAVVDGVSFEIPKGKVLSLIGPNGAGKSTVMGMLSRLITRDSGLVDFEGTEITRWKSRELSKRLAILTQANNVQMKLTVRELVAFGRFPYSGGRLTQEDNEIIDRAIAYMELGDFEEQFIDELSGGQRQRAYIAMVIAQDTEYILLDEPTNNLDIATLTILEDYLDRYEGIVVTVSHDRYFLDRTMRRIFAFEGDGKIRQYEGGYTDYALKKQAEREAEETETPKKAETATGATQKGQRTRGPQKLKFTYQEQKDYETIEADIAALEGKVEKLDKEMETASTDFVKLNQLVTEKETTEKLLEEKMDRWMYLEDLAARIAEQ